MKKENKKLAQQRRAEERKRREEKEKRMRLIKIGIPVALIVILIIVILADTFQSTDTTSTTEEVTTEAAETEALGYSTDTSLTVADGDTVNIDFVGSIDGVEFDGGNTNGAGADLTIGSGTYIDTFEEQLIGYHPGDEVEVYVTFPEDYGVDELNGQEALFVVTINGIY